MDIRAENQIYDFLQKGQFREYFLGQLTGKELEQFETQLMLVGEEYKKFFEQCEIAEEELIQDYVDGNLSDQELQLFNKNFIITDKRMKKINMAKAIRRVVNAENASNQDLVK